MNNSTQSLLVRPCAALSRPGAAALLAGVRLRADGPDARRGDLPHGGECNTRRSVCGSIFFVMWKFGIFQTISFRFRWITAFFYCLTVSRNAVKFCETTWKSDRRKSWRNLERIAIKIVNISCTSQKSRRRTFAEYHGDIAIGEVQGNVDDRSRQKLSKEHRSYER